MLGVHRLHRFLVGVKHDLDHLPVPLMGVEGTPVEGIEHPVLKDVVELRFIVPGTDP